MFRGKGRHMQNAKAQPVFDDYDLDLGMLEAVDRSMSEAVASKARLIMHAAWMLPLAIVRLASHLGDSCLCDLFA